MVNSILPRTLPFKKNAARPCVLVLSLSLPDRLRNSCSKPSLLLTDSIFEPRLLKEIAPSTIPAAIIGRSCGTNWIGIIFCKLPALTTKLPLPGLVGARTLTSSSPPSAIIWMPAWSLLWSGWWLTMVPISVSSDTVAEPAYWPWSVSFRRITTWYSLIPSASTVFDWLTVVISAIWLGAYTLIDLLETTLPVLSVERIASVLLPRAKGTAK